MALDDFHNIKCYAQPELTLMSLMQIKHPTLLLILDGWGHSDQFEGNAILQAHTPHWDHLRQQHPHTLLSASGTAVGLPEGQPGNSEVGHLHMGAGRLVPQDLLNINQSIQSGQFADHARLQSLLMQTIQNNGTLHLMGLLSAGGVHSHEEHLWALIEIAEKSGCHTLIHAFLDGRDTPPQSAHGHLDTIQTRLKNTQHVQLASISGRFWAMDRDQRWERTQLIYRTLTESQPQADCALTALHQAYQRGETDEFVTPIALHHAQPLNSHDTVLCFNFRSDRMHQLIQAIGMPTFTHFQRPIKPLRALYSMTHYPYAPTHTQSLFPPKTLKNTLGAIIEDHQLKQLRLAETEKYAHVTFFMDGGQETLYPNMEKILIPSPKVKTYDLTPAMSLKSLTKTLITALKNRDHALIIANFANADMVGHTGKLLQTIQAVESIDHCLRDLEKAVLESDTHCLITADHGNAEHMGTAQAPITAHTNNLVPFLYIGPNTYTCQSGGSLQDIAPTILALLDLPIPHEITGNSLLKSL